MRHKQLDPTLRSHYRVLYERQRLLGKSKETKRLYHFAFDELDRFLGRPAILDDLRDDVLIDLMSWIVERGCSNRTANRTRECLVSLWGFLARKRLVDQFPEVPRLPEVRRDPVAWLKPELSRLFRACVEAPGTVGLLRACDFWLALHCLLWDSADRIGAVMRCQWPWLSLETGWGLLPAETRKGRRSDLTFKLHPDTIAVLERIRQPAGLVLPFPYSPTYLWYLYGKLLASAGLPADRRHKFHCVRKSAGSWIEAAGQDATRALGHSSERTTRAHYLDPRITGGAQPADVLFRPRIDDDGPRAA